MPERDRLTAVKAARADEDPWLAHMRRGDFAAAWEVSDAILRERRGTPCWHWPRHEQYIWDGVSLAGRRVLVRCYHGLGDTIQFIRFMPQLKRLAAEVIVWAQPALLPLLQNAPGIDRLLPLHDGTPEVEYDIDIELMELPHALRTTLATLPADVPYLAAPAGGESWVRRSTASGEMAVGIVWRGGGWNSSRALPEALLTPLMRVSRVSWHALQSGSEARGEFFSPSRGPVEPIEELARALAEVDLMISIDSLPAHLAGALGVPTWTLLPYRADWRWMEDREDSPWYPTMRLWRQPSPGDWSSVIGRVAKELSALAAKDRRRPPQSTSG